MRCDLQECFRTGRSVRVACATQVPRDIHVVAEPVWAGRLRGHPMRVRGLLLLVAAVVFVPGFLAAMVAVGKVRESEREASLRGLRETVRASALLVDREVQRSLGAMTALAQSEHLLTGNLKGFYDQA